MIVVEFPDLEAHIAKSAFVRLLEIMYNVNCLGLKEIWIGRIRLVLFCEMWMAFIQL